MSKAWVEGICNETTGFLFPHQCSQFPQNHCGTCGKPICEDHTRDLEGKVLCPKCAGVEERRRGVPTSTDRGYHDTYYYGGTYYPGYGHYGPGSWGHSHYHHGSSSQSARDPHDPNALNAGDAESLRDEGGEDFETDMGDS